MNRHEYGRFELGSESILTKIAKEDMKCSKLCSQNQSIKIKTGARAMRTRQVKLEQKIELKTNKEAHCFLIYIFKTNGFMAHRDIRLARYL